MNEFIHMKSSSFECGTNSQLIRVDSRNELDDESLMMYGSDHRAGHLVINDYLLYWRSHLNSVFVVHRPLKDSYESTSTIQIDLGGHCVTGDCQIVVFPTQIVLVIPTRTHFVVLMPFTSDEIILVPYQQPLQITKSTHVSASADGSNLRVCLHNFDLSRTEVVYVDLVQTSIEFIANTESIIQAYDERIRTLTFCSLLSDGCLLTVAVNREGKDVVSIWQPDLQPVVKSLSNAIIGEIVIQEFSNCLKRPDDRDFFNSKGEKSDPNVTNSRFLYVICLQFLKSLSQVLFFVWKRTLVFDVHETQDSLCIISSDSQNILWVKYNPDDYSLIGRTFVTSVPTTRIVHTAILDNSILLVDRLEDNVDHITEIDETGHIVHFTCAPYDIEFDSIDSVFMLNRPLVNKAASLCCRLSLGEVEFMPVSELQVTIEDMDVVENFVCIGRRIFADQTRILGFVLIDPDVLVVFRQDNVSVSIRSHLLHFPINGASCQFRESCFESAQRKIHASCSKSEMSIVTDDVNEIAEQLEDYVRNELEKWSSLTQKTVDLKLPIKPISCLSLIDETSLALASLKLSIDVELEQRSTTESESHVFRARMLELIKMIIGEEKVTTRDTDPCVREFIEKLYGLQISEEDQSISLASIAVALFSRSSTFKQNAKTLIKALAGQTFAYYLFASGHFAVLRDFYVLDEFWAERNQCFGNLINATLTAARLIQDYHAVNCALSSSVLDECLLVNARIPGIEDRVVRVRQFIYRMINALTYLPKSRACSKFLTVALKTCSPIPESDEKCIDWHRFIFSSLITDDDESIFSALSAIDTLQSSFYKLKSYKSLFECLVKDNKFDAVIGISREEQLGDHPSFLDAVMIGEICNTDIYSDLKVCCMFAEVFVDHGVHYKAADILAGFISNNLSKSNERDIVSLTLERDILKQIFDMIPGNGLNEVSILTDVRFGGSGKNETFDAPKLSQRILLLDCIISISQTHKLSEMSEISNVINRLVDCDQYEKAIALSDAFQVPIDFNVIAELVVNGEQGQAFLKEYFTLNGSYWRKQALSASLECFMKNTIAPPDWLIELSLQHSPSRTLEAFVKHGFISEAVAVALHFLSKPTREVKQTASLMPMRMISSLLRDLDDPGYGSRMKAQLESAVDDYYKKLAYTTF
ncbi:hypothetical protein ACOME3_000741 [Neoechinorhynchus agilis]